MITIKTIAKKAGVSPTTASYALNGRPGVKKETREKVLRVAKELNYVPNYLAKSFRNGQSNTIAVLTKRKLEDGSIFANELMGIIVEAKKHNFDVLVKALPEKETNNEFSEILEGRKADGLILLGIGFEKQMERMLEIDAKFVLLSGHSKHKVNVVNIDGEKWMYNITKHVIEKGYKKPFYVSYALEETEEIYRKNGFVSALKEHNLFYKNCFLALGNQNDNIFNSINNIVNTMKVDSIVCWNDLLAFQVIDALKKTNRNIPEDIAVTGFDGLIQDFFFTPSLTTVMQPSEEKGKVAMKVLADLIKGDYEGPKKRFVECKLIIQNST